MAHVIMNHQRRCHAWKPLEAAVTSVPLGIIFSLVEQASSSTSLILMSCNSCLTSASRSFLKDGTTAANRWATLWIACEASGRLMSCFTSWQLMPCTRAVRGGSAILAPAEEVGVLLRGGQLQMPISCQSLLSLSRLHSQGYIFLAYFVPGMK